MMEQGGSGEDKLNHHRAKEMLSGFNLESDWHITSLPLPGWGTGALPVAVPQMTISRPSVLPP